MPVLSFTHSGSIRRDGGSTVSYSRFELDWSGLPAEVTIRKCYWQFDVSRQKGSVYARWYEYGNSANSGNSGVNAEGITFEVAPVTGTSGTARIYLGSQNGWTDYTNLTFHIEYAYKQSSMTLSASTVEAGKAITANISAQSSTATHTLTWKLGSNSQTQTLAAGVHGSSFTVPLTWLPNATSGTATCTLTTLEGGSQVGETQTLSFTVTVNAGVTPSCTVSAALVNGFAGLYLGGRSSVKLTIGNAQAGSGASLKIYKISGSGYSSTTQTATFGPLNAGTHTFTATVTDSRGRTGSATVSVTVQAYASPTLSGVSIYRSNSGGTASETGGYIALKATAAYTALNGANVVTLQGRYRSVNGAWSAWTAMTSGTRLLLGGGALSSTASYEAQIQAADTVGNTASYAAIIPTASVTFNLKAGGNGAAFGKYAEGSGLELASDWGLHRDGKSLTPAPRNLLDNSDFSNPVNQRRQTSYTGNGKYTVDRWYVGGSNNEATVNGSCVTVTTTVGTAYASLVQKVADASKLAGRTLTLAARVYSSAIPRILIGHNSTTLRVVRGTALTDSVLVATFTVPDNIQDGELLVWITGQSAATFDYIQIYWAALYEGSYTAETLPEYVPKGYGSELAECQRYYRCLRDPDLMLVTLGEGLAFTIHHPNMRVNPTITIKNPETGGTNSVTSFVNGGEFATTLTYGTNNITSVRVSTASDNHTYALSWEASADL